MLTYGLTNSPQDLQAILDLQQKNLPKAISKEEAIEQGFVTVEHDFALLKQMNNPYPHIVAKEDEKIVGYALVMLRKWERKIPVLEPMFEQINTVLYKKKLLEKARYFVMGQICIDKAYRGKGVFQGLYSEMKRQMNADFDYVITEISKRNTRSLRAHDKVGFENIKEYKADTGEIWVVVLLELNDEF